MLRTILSAALLAAVVAAPLHAEGVTDDEYKEIVTEFKRLWAIKGSLDNQLQGVPLLAKADDPRTTKMLWQLLLKHQGTDWIARRIFATCARNLKRIEGDTSIKYLLKNALKKMHPTRRADVLLSMARIKNPLVVEGLAKMAKNKSHYVRIAALDALGYSKSPKAIPPLVDGLKDKQFWQVRTAAMLGCVRQKAKPAVPVMIEMLSSETSRMQHDLLRALESLTRAAHTSVGAWREWWKANEKNRLIGGGMSAYNKLIGSTARTGEKTDKKKRDGTTEIDIPTFYGVEMTSNKIAFVIDNSESMLQKYKGTRPPFPKISVVMSGSKDDPLAKRRITLDWSKIKTYWDLSREQLIFTLKMIDEGTNFTIIKYGSKVKTWRNKVTVATPDNKAKAIKWLTKQRPDGKTNMFGACEDAFLVGGGKKDKLAQILFKEGIEAMYLLSDGAPTVGKIVQKRAANILERKWVGQFLAGVDDWNRMRKIQINTVGMGDSAEALMSGLAKASGGRYVTPGLRK